MVQRSWETAHVQKAMAIAVLAVQLFDAPRAAAAGPTSEFQVSSEDEKAIRAIVLERIDRFNKHEKPDPSSFTDDADFVNVYGMWRKGPAEIAERQGQRMETVLKEARINLLDLRIRFVRPDVAIVHQLHEMSGMRNEHGDTMPPHRELGVRVMVKERGQWLTTAFHNTIVRAAEAKAPNP